MIPRKVSCETAQNLLSKSMADEPENPAPNPEDTPNPPEENLTPPPMDDADPSASAAPPPDDSSPDTSWNGPVAIGQGKLTESEDKTFGMLAHLLGALTSFIGPLIIWLIKKDESPFVNDQGKEALNFQITIGIGYLSSFIVGMIPIVQLITCLIVPTVAVISLVFGILGCVEANKGKAYRYPFSLRLVN